MANITEHSETRLEGVDASEAGKQRFLFVNEVSGTVVSSPKENDVTVLVELESGELQKAVAVTPISQISTSSVESVNGQVGVVDIKSTNLTATVAGDEASVESHLNTLKNDIGDLGDSITDLRMDVVLKNATATQEISSPFKLKNQLNIVDDLDGAIQVSLIDGVATVATNNGLEIISDTKFDTSPTVVDDKDFNLLTNGQLVTKANLQDVISEVTGTHFEKWLASGKPEDLRLTTTLQKLTIPATTRFPNVPPADIEPTENGDGIKFKKAGLVHIKRNVSLGGSNTENLYYELRVNDQTLEPLQMQAVSVSKNTMNFSIEFYWQVSANQTLSIWANCVSDNCVLNYKGVTTFVEYL